RSASAASGPFGAGSREEPDPTADVAGEIEGRDERTGQRQGQLVEDVPAAFAPEPEDRPRDARIVVADPAGREPTVAQFHRPRAAAGQLQAARAQGPALPPASGAPSAQEQFAELPEQPHARNLLRPHGCTGLSRG